MPRTARLLLLPFTAAALLAGCHDDPAPDQAKKSASPVGDTQLRDAIQKPINRAKGVESKIQDEKDRTDKQLEDAGG